MAYFGSTQSSSLVNVPRLLVGRLQGVTNTTALSTNNPNQGSQGGNVWYYSSTNATTDLTASNFFSDGWFLGMRAGDMVMGAQFTSAASSVVTFWGAVVSASTAGVSLSTGSLVTSTFN